MLASILPDLDSFGLFFDWDVYQAYHHVLLHNLAFGVVVTIVSARWIGLRVVPLLLVFLAFLSHLVGDYFGSGAGWGITPFPPFSDVEYVYTLVPSDILVPNAIVTIAAILVTLAIALRYDRTPLELVHAGADRAVTTAIQLAFQQARCHACMARATIRCGVCGTLACESHAEARARLAPRCERCAASSNVS